MNCFTTILVLGTLFVTGIESNGCSFKYYNSYNSYGSVVFPDGYCDLLVEAPTGFQVELTVISYDIYSCDDYLKIYDGASSAATQIGTYRSPHCSSENSPFKITSSGNAIYVFYQLYGGSGNRLSVSWKTVKGCSHTFYNTSGTITFPYPVEEYQTCRWLIEVPIGNQVVLTVNHLEFGNSYSYSCNDNLKIYDGDDSTSTEIGTFGSYCNFGSVLPKIASSKNVLFILYETDFQTSKPTNFSISWEAENECGSGLTNETGIIESPHYKDVSPKYDDCVWIIHAPLRFQQILLKIEDFHLSSRGNDLVLIRDGPSSSSREIVTLKESSPYKVISSTGSDIRIESKRSGKNGGYRGFRMSWEVTACGGEVTNKTGVIKSLNYNESYYSLYDRCVWVIHAPASFKQILLKVEDFHFPSADDYLQIRDGPNDTSPEIGSFRGTTIYDVISSTGSSIWIAYKITALSEHHRGFRISWKAVDCGGEFNSTDGTIESSFYNQEYAVHDSCLWVINVPDGGEIVLKAEDVHVDQNSDSLEFRYFENAAERLSSSSSYRITSASAFDVTINSKRSSANKGFRGFRITWKVIDHKTEALEDMSGVITTEDIQSDDNFWIINAPQGFQITLNIEELNIVEHENRLTIRDGPFLSSPQIGIRENPVYKIISSTGKAMWINYWGRRSVNLKIVWKATNVCGGDITNQTGVIESPFYNMNYSVYDNCVWIIHAPQGFRQILLKVEDFNLDQTTQHYYMNNYYNFDSYLLIEDKSRYNYNTIGYFRDSKIYQTMSSTGRSMRITSSRNTFNNASRGFRIYWEATDIGGDVSATSGTIESPYYSHTYSAYDNFLWVIRAPVGFQITLKIDDVDLFRDRNCPDCYSNHDENDFIEIRDGSFGGSGLIEKFRVFAPYKVITSTTNELWIKTKRSTLESGFRGFSMSWEAKQRAGTFTDRNGVIESPFYNQKFSTFETFLWIIHAPIGQRIRLDVDDFQLDVNAKDQNYLIIKDGQYDHSPVIEECHGSEISSVISSTGNQIRIEAKRISTRNGFSGFKILWSRTVCVGDLNTATGTITSPNFPYKFPKTDRCVWRIHQVSPLVLVTLNVHEFELQPNQNCLNQYLEVRDGLYGTSPIIGRFCGNSIPQNISSSGHGVWVEFVTDTKNEYRGFNITW